MLGDKLMNWSFHH